MSPTLVGCGFDPQTNAVYQPAEGTNFYASEIDVLNAVVVADDAGEGRVIASLVNNTQQVDDALTGIEPGGDSSVQIDFGEPVDVPAGRLVNLAGESPIIASGSSLVPGSLVNLRWTFADAEAVTFQAVVVDEFGPFADLGPGSDADIDVDIPAAEGETGVEIGAGGDGGTAPIGD